MTSRGAYRGPSASGTLPGTLGKRIRRIRVAWRWTQGQLAERLNVDQQMVSLWERDKTQPSRSGMALLATLFGLEIETLMTGIGFTVPDMPPDSTVDGQNPLHRCLPQGIPGHVVVVLREGGACTQMTVQEAKRLLDQKSQKGACVWVVLDGDLG